MAWSSENEAYSSILDFLHRLNYNINNNNSYIALYPINIYELVALYIINIKIHLTIKKAQVLYMHTSISTYQYTKDASLSHHPCRNLFLCIPVATSQLGRCFFSLSPFIATVVSVTVCNHTVGGYVWNALVLMDVFYSIILCFSDCHVDINICIIW